METVTITLSREAADAVLRAMEARTLAITSARSPRRVDQRAAAEERAVEAERIEREVLEAFADAMGVSR